MVAPERPLRLAAELAGYPSTGPGRPLRLLFIHHSVGGQWLASPGPEAGARDLWVSHPNGGGLRAALEAEGYRVHDATRGTALGEATDLFDWPAKLRGEMPALAAYDVVLFKSCFPNSRFIGAGAAPGDPDGRRLTVWNARAAMERVRALVARQPGTLFVYVTAPPLVADAASPWWRRLAARARRWLRGDVSAAAGARLARAFNDWMSFPQGWLERYPQRNLVVFDYFDILTDHGRSNWLVHPSGDGTDPHPSAAGNRRATEELVPFLNRAVRRAGLAGEQRQVRESGREPAARVHGDERGQR